MQNRREFLKKSLVAASAVSMPMVIPGSALGKNGAIAPSDRIVMGCIGVGGQGQHNMRQFISQPDTQVVALCDVEQGIIDTAKAYHYPWEVQIGLKPALEQAIQTYNTNDKDISDKEIDTYTDFRELLSRKDIDAVTVCTPDHWHGLISIAAAEAGKDIYCEKPLVNSIAEGRAVCDAVKKHSRILQTGSHERSNDSVRFANELVQNGYIGELKEIYVNMPNNDPHHMLLRENNKPKSPEKVPDGLDYNFWLGPASYMPFHSERAHFWWRFHLEFGGGEITDRGAHIIDLAQFISNHDNSGPIHIKAKGEGVGHGLYDCFIEYDFECTYKNGLKLCGVSKAPRGLKLVGTDGWIFIHIHGGRLEASNPEILGLEMKPDEIHIERSPGHHRNFLDSVKTRRKTVAHEEIGHRTATICHLLNIGMKSDEPIEWNPKTEQITNSDKMNSMVKKPMRNPWKI